jgi:hypothetical protein
VRAALHEFGYALRPNKGWQVFDRRDEPEVTGAILTRHGGVRLPARLVRVMRELARSDDPRDAQRLGGYEGYEKMVTRSPKKRRKNKKKAKHRRPRPAPPFAPPTAPTGGGDWVTITRSLPEEPEDAPRPGEGFPDDDEDIPF